MLEADRVTQLCHSPPLLPYCIRILVRVHQILSQIGGMAAQSFENRQTSNLPVISSKKLHNDDSRLGECMESLKSVRLPDEEQEIGDADRHEVPKTSAGGEFISEPLREARESIKDAKLLASELCVQPVLSQGV
jgi:hypothetical protein